jgi:hypothetical protein
MRLRGCLPTGRADQIRVAFTRAGSERVGVFFVFSANCPSALLQRGKPVLRADLQYNPAVNKLRIATATRLAILLIALGFAYGCVVVPHPMSKRVAGAGGSALPAEPNLSEIRVGTTTRQEIDTKAAAVNAGWSSRNLFLGRWARSGMGFTGARSWGTRNLVVEFDDRDLVKGFNECGDRDLVRILPVYLKTQADRPVFAEPVKRTARTLTFPASLVIEKDAIVFNDVRILRSSILKVYDMGIPERTLLHSPPNASKSPDPLQVEVILQLKEKRDRSDLLDFETEMSNAVLLLQVLSQ